MKKGQKELNQKQIDELLNTKSDSRIANQEEVEKIEQAIKWLIENIEINLADKEIVEGVLNDLDSPSNTIYIHQAGTASITVTKKAEDEKTICQNTIWIRY
ncbi:hypothetical protein ACFYKT_04280 [Cytobacillus sp. FJAT-53684]|uniref:Uncharacterized protein n=1 Tax=Cytobacillus mangrovibacter TaxID=3299024 RepID=A0ABW6JUM0_9BACI